MLSNFARDIIESRLAVPVAAGVPGPHSIGKMSDKYPVEVRSAGAKGNGVFATKTIKKGHVCCYYDGLICDGSIRSNLTCGTMGYTQVMDREGCDAINGEGNHLAKFPVLAGFRTQLRRGGCAQLCNDFSTSYTQEEADDPNSWYRKGTNVMEQFATVPGKKNPKQRTLCFVATRKIRAGEELFYCYGPVYWKNKGSTTVEEVWSEVVKEGAVPKFAAPVLEEDAGYQAICNYNHEGLELKDYINRLVAAEAAMAFHNLKQHVPEELREQMGKELGVRFVEGLRWEGEFYEGANHAKWNMVGLIAKQGLRGEGLFDAVKAWAVGVGA